MPPLPRRRFLALAGLAPLAPIDGAKAQIIGGGGWSIRGTDPVEIYQGDRRVTAYHAGYAEGLPHFDPLVGPSGAVFTAPMARGETAAEVRAGGNPPRVTGLWFALDGVNGRDFHPAPEAAAAPGGRPRGRIVHKGMNGVLIQGSSLTIRVKSEWMDEEEPQRRICSDRREFAFSYAKDGALVVDATIELMADAGDLEIGGGATGSWTLRAHPSLAWTGAAGEVALRNSEGLADGLVPGARARWIACQGKDAKGSPAGVALLDHPDNPGAPSAWAVSDDGRLAAKPFPEAGPDLAAEAKGAEGAAKEEKPENSGPRLLPNGESLLFRYRLILHAEATNIEAIEAAWESFAAR